MQTRVRTAIPSLAAATPRRTSLPPLAAALGLLACIAGVPRLAGGASLIGLGDLPGGDYWSEATGVSANGQIVVGFGYDEEGPHAFRWHLLTGMIELPHPAGWETSRAWGVSDDGSVVVGRFYNATDGHAFRWTSQGMVDLGTLPGDTSSIAAGVSGDGSVVVGTSDSSFAYPRGFRWTEADGMVDLGDLPGGLDMTVVEDVSGDGAVVVGWSAATGCDEPYFCLQ